uniref:Uncharacterized protein n=1 Tax=Micrurus carvalhoi TaxID=3147026 RepID=A0A2H6N9V1_9SAUR
MVDFCPQDVAPPDYTILFKQYVHCIFHCIQNMQSPSFSGRDRKINRLCYLVKQKWFCVYCYCTTLRMYLIKRLHRMNAKVMLTFTSEEEKKDVKYFLKLAAAENIRLSNIIPNIDTKSKSVLCMYIT